MEAWEQEIALGMARALFVSAWANKRQEARMAAGGNQLAFSTGFNAEQWEAQAPTCTAPRQYHSQAWRLIGRIEEANGRSLDIIFRTAMKADGHHFAPPEGYARAFGRDLAYQAIGRAISWFDTHETFGLIVPYFES